VTESSDDISKFIQRVVVFRLENLCRPGTVVSLDDDVVDRLRISSDDLSFDFIPNVEAELGVNVPQKDWYKVRTVGDTCELLEAYYRKRKDLPR
jgi:acyl carrier protein